MTRMPIGFLADLTPYRRILADGDAPARPTLPMPIVFEPAERMRYEYRILSLDPREEPLPDEAALAALGAEGWLLAGIVDSDARRITYYFVRPA